MILKMEKKPKRKRSKRIQKEMLPTKLRKTKCTVPDVAACYKPETERRRSIMATMVRQASRK